MIRSMIFFVVVSSVAMPVAAQFEPDGLSFQIRNLEIRQVSSEPTALFSGASQSGRVGLRGRLSSEACRGLHGLRKSAPGRLARFASGVDSRVSRCRKAVATSDDSAAARASAGSQGGVMADLKHRIELTMEHRDLILQYGYAVSFR
ncbi:MAG: hypothetical protein RIK87_00650 [Fuerstiella sp.]